MPMSASAIEDAILAALPGAMIFVTSIAFNLLADGVRSAMELRR